MGRGGFLSKSKIERFRNKSKRTIKRGLRTRKGIPTIYKLLLPSLLTPLSFLLCPPLQHLVTRVSPR